MRTYVRTLALSAALATLVPAPSVAQICDVACPTGDHICNGCFTLGNLQEWAPFCSGNPTCACGTPPANCVAAVTEGAEKFARADVRFAATGESWRLKLRQKDHSLDSLQEGRLYELTFRARTATSFPAGVSLAQTEAGGPEANACSATWAVMKFVLEGGGVWRDYAMTFRSPDTLDELRALPGFAYPDPNHPCHAKTLPEEHFVIGLGEQAGLHDVDDVHIRELTQATPYDNSQVGTFEPHDEYWFAQKDRHAAQSDGAELSGPPGENHELKLTLGPDSGLFVYRYLYLDIDPSQLEWDLTLDVRTDTPQNVGRMYVILRSTRPPGDATEDFLFHSFSGLSPGVNTIRIGSELTTVNPDLPDACMNQSDVAPSGRVCDLYQPWFSQGFDWHKIYTIGIKLETNGNGGAVVFVDDLQLRPWNAASPSPSRRPPIVSRVHVKDVSSTQATVAWRTDQCARSKVVYGLQPGVYPWQAEDPTETLVDHDVTILGNLLPGTRYHARVVSASCYTECTGHICPIEQCEPCPPQGTGKTGLSGDFTFVTAPSPSLVPAPGPQDPVFYPVGVQGVPTPADISLAVGSGFNVLQTSLFGGCYELAPPGSGDPDVVAENARATAFLDAAWNGSGAKSIVSNFCTTWVAPGSQAIPDAELDDYVTAKVNGVKSKPGLYGYYLFDEPEFFPDGVALRPRLEILYDAAVAADPDPGDPNRTSHPMMTGTTYFSSTHPFGDLIDRPMNDVYPFPLHPLEWIITGDAADQGDGLAELEQEVAAAGKIYEFIFQAYSPELDKAFPVGREVTVYPTEAQMRAMAYLGVIYNARGLWAFAMSQVVPFPGTEWMWAGLSNLSRELRRLEPVLADTEAPTHPPAPPALKTGLKEYQGYSFLITVNASAQTCASCVVDLDVPHRYLGGSPVEVLEENRSFGMVDEANVTDTWNPYEVHIYRVPRDNAAPQVTLSVTTQPIRKKKPVSFQVVATDNAALNEVEFEVPAVPGCTTSRLVSQTKTTTQPFSCTFPASGSYTVKARAYDFNDPERASSDATVTVIVP